MDLLSKNGTAKLDLKEKDGTVYVKDLSTFVIKTPENMLKVFNEGQLNTSNMFSGVLTTNVDKSLT